MTRIFNFFCLFDRICNLIECLVLLVLYQRGLYYIYFQNESYYQNQVCDSENIRIKEGECDGTSDKDWASLVRSCVSNIHQLNHRNHIKHLFTRYR